MDLAVRLRMVICDDSGQSLLEFGMLVTLIALITMFAVTSSGVAINRLWTGIATSLAAVA